MRVLQPGTVLAVLVALPALAGAQTDDERLVAALDARVATYRDLAREIFGFAEVGYQESKSSARLQAELRQAGFIVDAGVARMPTAFVASYGSGTPVIGILAEFDALPGLSQDTTPVRKPLIPDGAGHACGHHLFGTASTAAAIAVKGWLARSGASGTIRVYGTPAEEGGSGKVYMVRAGLFGDVDAVLHWHASDRNDASPATTLANRSAKFRFRGVATHAAGAPERGRSALDGVEAMNHMANLLREHVPQETRIHYIITRGGTAPNIVPEFAEVYYYVRHPDARVLLSIWGRVEQAARGAAVGTGTDVEWELIHGNHAVLPNTALAQRMDANLRRVGGVHYTPAEVQFAKAIRASYDGVDLPLGSEQQVQAFREQTTMGSTDVGDVSWMAPTAGLDAATWVPGTAAHSWQAVAAGGMSIGTKGMMVAAKTLALTALDLYRDQSLLEQARKEWQDRRGSDFRYEALLGDRDPPLDYRK